MSKKRLNKLITVCSACLRVSCLAGQNMCEKARTAGTVEKKVAQLMALNREHPSWYTEDRDRNE